MGNSLTFPFMLFPFQCEASEFLQRELKALLCDDMGLGKSYSTLHALCHLNANPVLLIVPKSTIPQWVDLIKQLNCSYVVGEPPKKLPTFTITNYARIRYYFQDYYRQWDAIVLDEGSKIKNYTAQITQKILSLPDSRIRFVLTGTPIENRKEDILPLLDFIGEDSHFNITYYFYEWAISYRNRKNYVNSYRLEKVIQKKVFRRKKELHVPKVHIPYPVTLEGQQRRIYDELLNYAQEEANCSNFKISHIFGLITRLRQICIDPSLIYDDYNLTPVKYQHISKIIDRHLSSYENDQFVIFSEFKEALLRLSTELKVSNFILHGGHTLKQRKKIQQQFQAGKKRVLLCTKAGEYGINLQSACVVIHLDQAWNPARMRQREDRCYRIGQNRPCYCILLIATDTIEENFIMEVLQRKEALFQEYIDWNSVGTIKLNREFLMKMLFYKKREKEN